MAGPILGKHLKWWFNGIPFYLATNDFSLDLQVEALDATCYGPGTSKQYEPGLRDASEVSASGFFIEDVAGGQAWDTVIHSALRSAVPCLASIEGGANGDSADLWISKGVKRSVAPPLDGLITADWSMTTKDGVALGYIVHTEAARTGTWTGSTVDLGAAQELASTPWRFVVEVTAWTSTMTATLETSPDGSTWTGRGTISGIGAIGGYSLDGTTVLGRYRRVTGTGAGTLVAGNATIA